MSVYTTTEYVSLEEFKEFIATRCPPLEKFRNPPKAPFYNVPLTIGYHYLNGDKPNWKNVLAREYIYQSGELKYEIWPEHPLLLNKENGTVKWE